MKKILIVTDAWKPQVNGVVTTMTTIVEELKKKGFHVDVIHPACFIHFHFQIIQRYHGIFGILKENSNLADFSYFS